MASLSLFNRPGNHNKFVFDSEAGLWKRKYSKFALNQNNTTLQWAKGGLTNGGENQLKAIANFMNDPLCSWQKTRNDIVFTVRKTIVLPHIKNIKRFEPYAVTGISKNYAFATIGFHKVAQRHLMNLSDSCLRQAFNRTPEDRHDESVCGSWDTVDLSTSAFPRLSEPNKAHRIQGKYARDGGLVKSLRFTPLFNKEARIAVTRVKRKRRRKVLFPDISDKLSKLDSRKTNPNQVSRKKKRKRN